MASKNLPPPPPYCFGNFDAHQSELKELVNEVFFEDALFVHFFDQRTDFVFGKLADVVAEKNFVFGEAGQGGRGGGLQHGLRHIGVPSKEMLTKDFNILDGVFGAAPEGRGSNDGLDGFALSGIQIHPAHAYIHFNRSFAGALERTRDDKVAALPVWAVVVHAAQSSTLTFRDS